MSTNLLRGTIFDLQHFSVSDGPGIRTTVFFKGCPLRCLWCHNPESYSSAPQVFDYASRCVSCGKCVAVCPNGCHRIEGGQHLFDRTACTSCGRCAAACLQKSLELAGRRMSVEEVLQEVLEDRFFYESSGGGITLSGGEPMFQAEFAVELARAAKKVGLHTAIETSGFCKTETLLEIAPHIDLFLYDYKATGDALHRACTGASQALILQNLTALDQAGANLILRCPMIPGYNLEEAHVSGIIAAAKPLTHLKEIHLEPYHNIGISKRLGLGMQEHTQLIPPPETGRLREIAEQIQSAVGISVVVM